MLKHTLYCSQKKSSYCQAAGFWAASAVGGSATMAAATAAAEDADGGRAAVAGAVAAALSFIARYSATVGFRCASAAAARLLARSLACSCKLIMAGTQPQSQLAGAPALCSFFGWPNGVKPGNIPHSSLAGQHEAEPEKSSPSSLLRRAAVCDAHTTEGVNVVNEG